MPQAGQAEPRATSYHDNRSCRVLTVYDPSWLSVILGAVSQPLPHHPHRLHWGGKVNSPGWVGHHWGPRRSVSRMLHPLLRVGCPCLGPQYRLSPGEPTPAKPLSEPSLQVAFSLVSNTTGAPLSCC